MYSRFQLVKKYLKYYFHSSNGKGHGTHSPFVFDFIIHVLDSREKPGILPLIEQYRKRMLADDRKIIVNDFGAGSTQGHSGERKISDIAASSLKNKKFASLLYRIAKYYQCKNIIEFGTSLGTTTAYLADASPEGKILTLEGASRIADLAEDFFESLSLQNIQLKRGKFDDIIPQLISNPEKIDLLYVDGNHQEEPTYHYFESFLNKSHNDSIFIFDDIHWSEGMELAWQRIKQHPSVTLSIDLFFIGLIFFKKEFLVKQDFTIRF